MNGWEAGTSAVGHDGQERWIFRHVKLLSSSLQEASFWPKNDLRSDLIASKFNTSLIDVCAYTHAIVI